MVCIYCGNDTHVVNSRPQKRTNSVWRRRMCLACRTVFTSVEEVDLSGSVVVRKANSVEPFSREKLLLSVYDSLRHRKTAIEDATGLMNTILSQLYSRIEDASLTRDAIAEVAAATLRRFDKAAATHYCAFHPLP